ncbi:MAG TPA: GMC family oxidoreductase N-terminal domain-containing protein, partial [Blastocatellia bacterium]|nr:GMC family oxidoreductase N-terminal domain-containing protein [Blastocatellia bacterium]
MVPVLNFHGYTAVDPLDRTPRSMRFVLTIAVSAVVAFVFLYGQSAGLHVISFPRPIVMWIGIAAYAFVMAPLLVVLRKSSSLLFYLIIVGVCVPLDLFFEAHCRTDPLRAPWIYEPEGLLGPVPVPLKFLVAWSFDGIIQGPLVLWFARLLADLMYPASKSEAVPTFGQNEALFPPEWSDETVNGPARDAGYWLLLLIGLGYFVYAVFSAIGALGASPWPGKLQHFIILTYENPALGIFTFSKLGLVVLLTFVGAYNRNVRWHCALVLFTAHITSVIASLGFYFFAHPLKGPLANVFSLASCTGHPECYLSDLLTSAIVDGALVLVFAWLLIRHRNEAEQFAPTKEEVRYVSLPDGLLKIFFYLLSAAMALSLVGAVLLRVRCVGLNGLSAVFGYPDPELANSITRFSTLSVLALLLAKRENLRDYFTSILIAGFVITLIGSSVFLLLGTLTGQTGIMTRWGVTTNVDWFFMAQIAAAAAIVALLIGLRKLSYKVDYMVNVLNPSSAQNVIALHQALYPASPVEDSAVLGKIDRYVAGIRGSKRAVLSFPFWVVEHLLSPIFGLHPTFSNMSNEEGRYFLRRYLLRSPRERARAFVPLIAGFAYRIGTAVQAFVTFAHFTTIPGWGEIGYIPPDARDRLQGDAPVYRPPMKYTAPLPDSPEHPANDKPAPPPMKALIAPRISSPVAEAQIPPEVDYLIVGSGAGGACMAYRLACEVADPSRILVIETGARLSPLQDFKDDEMEMIRTLYKDGGLQMSKRFDLRVLQGECVGGSTVVNNAICLKMPDAIRQIWKRDYGLCLSELDGEYTRIGKELEISRIPDVAVNHIVEEKFAKGLKGTSLNGPVDLHANQRNMVGDGLCNLGNKRLRKRSMLETYLPWAEARGVKIIGETTALCFEKDESGKRADGVYLRTSHGDTRRVQVQKAVIVSGGAIASSHFLMRSGVIPNVGVGMSCNFAFPVAFEFREPLFAFDGAQITRGAFDPDARASFETYFNPPGAFALSLPFCFNRADVLMKQYRCLVNFGALVGSEPNGIIKQRGDPTRRRPLAGQSFDWHLGPRDQANIKYAMNTLLDLGLAAEATRCVLPTDPGLDIPLNPDNVLRFKKQLETYPL